jgi:hypothetical protein
MVSVPSWGLVRRGRSRERGTAVKTKCCKSYQRKGKACKKCPVMAHLDPKAQKPWRKPHK